MNEYIAILQKLLNECNEKINDTDTQQRVYWLGVRFGLETALAEAERLLMNKHQP